MEHQSLPPTKIPCLSKASGGQTGSRRVTKEPGAAPPTAAEILRRRFHRSTDCASADMSVFADDDKVADLCIAIDPALNPRFAFGSRIASDPVGPQVGKDEFDAGSCSRRQ